MEVATRADEELREQAIFQLKKKRDFRTHAFIYLLVQRDDAYARKPLSEDEIQREARRLRS